MFRFTIRDVLWLTVALAFAVCWYLERDGRVKETDHIKNTFRENESLKEQLREAEAAIFRAEAKARPAIHPPMVSRENGLGLADSTPNPPPEVATIRSITPEEAVEIVRRTIRRESGDETVFDCDAAESDEGYDVFVTYGGGRDGAGRLTGLYPGGYAIYRLSKTGKLVRVVGGL